jgi:hypothetical protein
MQNTREAWMWRGAEREKLLNKASPPRLGPREFEWRRNRTKHLLSARVQNSRMQKKKAKQNGFVTDERRLTE